MDYPLIRSENYHLKTIEHLRKETGCLIGLSDHTLGNLVACLSVAFQSCIIEKHITLDKNMQGPDHKASIEPEELNNLVSAIRNIEKALGNGIKKPSNSELKNIKVVRKSIIASDYIEKGERYTTDNLCIKRPGTGLSPTMFDLLLGM